MIHSKVACYRWGCIFRVEVVSLSAKVVSFLVPSDLIHEVRARGVAVVQYDSCTLNTPVSAHFSFILILVVTSVTRTLSKWCVGVVGVRIQAEMWTVGTNYLGPGTEKINLCKSDYGGSLSHGQGLSWH